MTNYAKMNIGNEGRVELHDTLSLTGAEVSINKIPAGECVPFVHSHIKQMKRSTAFLKVKAKPCSTEKTSLFARGTGCESHRQQSAKSSLRPIPA